MVTTSAGVSAVVVRKVVDPQERAGLAQRLAELSSTTEMKAYGVEQWQFLLNAAGGIDNSNDNDIKRHAVTPFVVVTRETTTTTTTPNKDQGQAANPILGCVLRIDYGANDFAYGMMLVSPRARGQGLARKLLTAAMEQQPQQQSPDSTVRHILGTCTELGRPFYEKVGYQRVATVTRMTAAVEDLKQRLNVDDNANDDIRVSITPSGSSSSSLSSPLWSQFLALDKQATGLDRSTILTAIHDYDYVQTLTISKQSKEGDTLVAAALLTQHTESSTVMVGPLLGDASYVPRLLQAVVLVDPKNPTTGNKSNAVLEEIALIVADHADLVRQLHQELGFEIAFELGAMTLEGRPLPGRRDLYLGLLHPTLG
mmetsp:Transcript_3759/g.7712  ORF Transcript_3759/g.7712 Transcript_3759/m.7712 type:complete len:369 (+) Transcript_3759:186-1292(+)